MQKVKKVLSNRIDLDHCKLIVEEEKMENTGDQSRQFKVQKRKNLPLFRKRPKESKPSGAPFPPSALVETQVTGASDVNIEDEHLEKVDFCVNLLKLGRVQSYGDFFLLTHRPEPNSQSTNAPENSEKEIDIPVEEMKFLADMLVEAEGARRERKTQIVFARYNSLAKYFLEKSDVKSGIYFYEKCLEIARLTSDSMGEMSANNNLGTAHYNIGNSNESIRYHEDHLRIAEANHVESEKIKANSNLVLVYEKQANLHHEEGNIEAEISCRENCLKASRNCNDPAIQGDAHQKLGKVLLQKGNAEDARMHFEQYLEIATKTHNKEAEASANLYLSQAAEYLNDTGNAINRLETYLQMSQDIDNLTSQARAYSNLGYLYSKNGEHSRAVENFEKNFETARSLVSTGEGARDILDKSRVCVGMSRGNAHFKEFMEILKKKNDLTAILQWKTKRTWKKN